jgi:hypothetical protein
MLLMGLFGATVLALVCWVALRESEPTVDAVIPQPGSESQEGAAASTPRPAAGVLTAQPGELDDATVADADTEEALAAAAALWSVLTQDRG